VIGACINEIKSGIEREGISFIQQFSMRKGLKAFGIETGMNSMTTEIKQLHKRNSFKPRREGESVGCNHALDTIRKSRRREVKTSIQRKKTRKWLSREETASPTVSLESINLTFAIVAHAECICSNMHAIRVIRRR